MHCDYEQLPHKGIRSLKPYIPGKSADELASERGLTDILKLASNENPLGCSPLALKALSTLSAKTIATYPMSLHHPLRQKLASLLNVETPMITIGNGTDAIFCLLLTCFALHTDKHILTHDYAFSSYGIQAKTLGIPVVSTGVKRNWEIDIDAMIAAVTPQTALIFIANPNNPTGLLVKQADIKRLLQSIPSSTILVLDEAYYEYVDEADKAYGLELLKSYPNLVITRTFSKAYGLAGLRIGYAIAHPAITSLLYRIQLPFVVNIAAMTAAFAALDDLGFLEQSTHMTKLGLKQLQEGLTALNINYLPSAGNFITFDCNIDSMPIYEGLQEYGIIVRPLHPYGLNQFLRVTVGTKEQNIRFLDKIRHLLNALNGKSDLSAG